MLLLEIFRKILIDETCYSASRSKSTVFTNYFQLILNLIMMNKLTGIFHIMLLLKMLEKKINEQSLTNKQC